MNIVKLTAGDACVELAPEVGGSIASYVKAGLPVLRPMLAGNELGARGMGSYPLVPFSNRIAYRRFDWAGERYRVPVLLGGHALHGVGWQVPWRVGASSGAGATLEMRHGGGPLWPFAFDAAQTVNLTQDALDIGFSITSRHDAPAPAGFGLHPFFPRTPMMRLRFQASHVWHNDEPEKIPVYRSRIPAEWDHGAGLAVGQGLNQCYAGWDGEASLTYPEHGRRVSIRADAIFRHLVVFVPEGMDFLAVEPVSNMNDGINRMAGGIDHGVFVLAPGETVTGRVRFQVDAI